jgi:hypothetical protein
MAHDGGSRSQMVLAKPPSIFFLLCWDTLLIFKHLMSNRKCAETLRGVKMHFSLKEIMKNELKIFLKHPMRMKNS